MKTMLTGADFCAMIHGASTAIALETQHINDLNVFPVPDGDTGTNMSLTMSAGATEIQKKQPATVTAAADVAASALLRGARGNSGVILSLLFRGLSKGLKDMQEVDTLAFANALQEGVGAAYKAVMKPAEGTMLTVSRVASAAAVEFAEANSDFFALFEHTIAVGYDALALTIEQNPVLKKAGVVDAGAKGYLFILEGMLKALRGEEITAATHLVSVKPIQVDAADFSSFHEEEINFDYCTEFIVARENEKDPNALRGFLDAIGDSLVVVEDDEIIKVHVHTDDPLRALTEGFTYGRLLNVKIENMRDQHAEMAADKAPEIAVPEKPFGFVAVSAGEGLTDVFSDLGVDFIVTGGQTMNPSTDEILNAIHSVPAETVFVLPNNKNIILASQQAVELSEKNVMILPTKTVPQGISALLAVNPEAGVDENFGAMTTAYQSVRTAQITFAARDSDFDGHDIKAGEFLALSDDGLLGSAADFDAILEMTVASFAAHAPEFIMLYYGEGVSEDEANATAAKITATLPAAEVAVIYGGQPVYSYMISAE